MKIAYLVPGSGGSFYCENCTRDLPLIRSLRRQGVEVDMVPLYLPLFTGEGKDESALPVYFGAVNMYMDHKFPSFSRWPGFFRNLLDSRPVLRLAARFSGSTDARGLEDMTLDMISGDSLEVSQEYRGLLDRFRGESRPDVIHLSNALLLGLGRRLAQDLDRPLVCSLQDEDVWIDAMAEPFRTRAWDLLRAGAKDVARFFPVSRYFGRFMAGMMDLPDSLMTVISPGMDRVEPPPRRETGASCIGYLSRLSAPYGLDVLAEAYLSLRSRPGLEDLELHIGGGFTSLDLDYVRRVRKLLKEPLAQGRVHFHSRFDVAHRRRFFSRVDVLSVPLRRPEAFGTYILEALSHGVPVVQPALGAIPEILEATGGGLAYLPEPDPATALEQALARLLGDETLRHRMATEGREAVRKDWTNDISAGSLKTCYAALTQTPEALSC